MRLKKNQINRFTFIAAIFFLILFILSMIVANIISDNWYSKENKHRNAREGEYRNIVNHLEYNGLDDAAKALMENFNKKYSEYANFIVIDSDFNILYHLNKGFINDEGKFYVITDDSGRAFICDQEGNVLSAHGLETSNIDVLRRLTLKSARKNDALPSSVDSEPTVSVVTGSNYPGIQSDRITYIGPNAGYSTEIYFNSEISTSTNLRFHSIQSKNLNLCYIYDENSPLWNLRTNNSSQFYSASNALGVIAGFSFFLYWLGLALFVFLDARRHDNHPALWGVLTLFTNIVGLVVYLAVRPERIYCSSCREPLGKNHSYCPICGMRNRAKCLGCGTVVQGEWAFCANCGTGVGDVSTAPEASDQNAEAH